MLIKIGYDMTFQTTFGVPMNLALYTHPSREGDLLSPDTIRVEDSYGRAVPTQTMLDCYGNKIGRIVSPGGRLRISSENIIRDSGLMRSRRRMPNAIRPRRRNCRPA